MSSLDLFLLCAGKGERLRPLTDAVPKPLTTLLGKTLAERALEACAGLPVTSTLVNAHHLAPSVETFAKAHGIGHVQVEPTLLDFDPQAPDPVDELAARRAVRSA